MKQDEGRQGKKDNRNRTVLLFIVPAFSGRLAIL
jgi:hypothetical protein